MFTTHSPAATSPGVFLLNSCTQLPITGPSAKNDIGIPMYIPIAFPRSPGANCSITSDADAGCIRHAATPWRTRPR